MQISDQERHLDVTVVDRFVAWPSRPVTGSPSPVHNQSQESHLGENRWQQEWHPPPAESPLRSLLECTHPAFHCTGKEHARFTSIYTSLLIQKVAFLMEMIPLTFFSWDGVKAKTRVCFCPGFKHLRLLRSEKLPCRSNRDDLSLLFLVIKEKVHFFKAQSYSDYTILACFI